MTKRDFFRVLTVGTAVSLGFSTTSWAQRMRILGERRELPREPSTYAVNAELASFLSGVRAGDRSAHRELNVFWLHGSTREPRADIITLEEARKRGELGINELEHATVTAVAVQNRGKTAVLLLAGEIVLGGKQNRVVAEDVLLPALSASVAIPVYCVEQGRWSETASKSFGARGTFAAPALRARVIERADQGQVWATVHRYSAAAAAPSPTASYQAIHDKPEVRSHQREVRRAIGAVSGAIGAAVFIHDRLMGLDLFADLSLFEREWPQLLDAYAVETYGNRRSASDRPSTPADESRQREQVARLPRSAAEAEGALRPGRGVGSLFEFRLDPRRGNALIHDGQVVHTAML